MFQALSEKLLLTGACGWHKPLRGNPPPKPLKSSLLPPPPLASPAELCRGSLSPPCPPTPPGQRPAPEGPVPVPPSPPRWQEMLCALSALPGGCSRLEISHLSSFEIFPPLPPAVWELQEVRSPFLAQQGRDTCPPRWGMGSGTGRCPHRALRCCGAAGALALQKPISPCRSRTLGSTRNIPAPRAPAEPWQGPAAVWNRDTASCHPLRRF